LPPLPIEAHLNSTAESSYDLFISYSQADRGWVEGYLLDALAAANVRVISELNFSLGAPRLAEFERAMRQSKRTLLVLSPAYMAESGLQFVDLMAQSYGLELGAWPVIPLILEEVELPPRLKLLMALDATTSEQRAEAVARLCADLQKPPPGPAPRPACPYPGMRAFREQESQFFHGRTREIESLVQSLRRHRFMAVIGASGSGKSSLVFAGLLPALKSSALFGDGDWLVKQLRPGAHPLAALSAQFGGDQIDDARVSALLAGQEGAARLLLVVDQFEETFTQGEGEAPTFIKQVLRLCEINNCYVVLTARADFYGDLMTSELWPQVQAHRLEVNPLNEAGLREAIEKPAEDVGVFIESALTERLVAGSVRQPGVLPFVQEILVRLWDKLERRFLPLRAYDALVLSYTKYTGVEHSGLQAAMAQLADDLIAKLTPTQQSLAQRTFLRLVQFGEGRADTRRQQSLVELRANGDDPIVFDATIHYLADNRMLTLSGEEGGEPRVDISHEAMLTGWPMLHDWIETRRNSERTRRQLEGKAQEYIRLRAEGGGLLDEIELTEAEKWLSSKDAAELGVSVALQTLIADSRRALTAAKAQAAREQRFRRLALVVGALLIILILAVYGLQQTRMVSQQQESIAAIETKSAEVAQALDAEMAARAETRRQLIISQSRQVAAVARNRLIGGDAEMALLLAIAADHLITDTMEARDVAHDALDQWRSNQTINAHAERIGGVRFSTNGRLIATYSDDGVVQLRPIEAGRVVTNDVTTFKHVEMTTGLVFSSDSKRVATSSRDDTAAIWDTTTGERLFTLDHKGDVRSIIPNFDRTVLATRSEREVMLWDFATGRRLLDKPLTAEGPVRALTFSPDGRHIWAGSDDVTAYLWNVASGGQVRFGGFQTAVVHVAWSPDGRYLAASDEKVLNLWDAERSFTQVQLGQSSGNVAFKGITFSPDGRFLFANGGEGILRAWSTTSLDKDPQIFHVHQGGISGQAFSQDGQWMATTDLDGLVWLWRMDTLTPETMLSTGAGDAAAPQFSPDSSLLAVADEAGRFYVWRVQSDAALAQLQAADRPYKALALTGDRLFYGGVDGKVGWWNWANGATGHYVTKAGQILTMAASPDGALLATGDISGVIRLLRSEDGTKIRSWQAHPNDVRSLLFLPDGVSLASTGGEPTIRVWNLDDGDLLRTLRGHDNDVNDLALSADGGRLFSASHDGSVRGWDWRTGEQNGTYTLHAPALALAVSTDGQWLAAAGDGVGVLAWPLGQHGAEPVVLPHVATVRTLLFTDDGALVSGDASGALHLWSLTERSEADFQAHNTGFRVDDLTLSADGRVLFSVGDDGVVRAWPLATSDLLYHVCIRLPRGLTEAEQRDYLPFAEADDACRSLINQQVRAPLELPPPQDDGGQATAALSPTIYFLESLSGSRVAPGEPARLRWSTTNADGGVYLEVNGQLQGVASPGEKEFQMTGPTTFRLIARKPNGVSRVWQLVVDVARE
jgi:WD40 repeat protein